MTTSALSRRLAGGAAALVMALGAGLAGAPTASAHNIWTDTSFNEPSCSSWAQVKTTKVYARRCITITHGLAVDAKVYAVGNVQIKNLSTRPHKVARRVLVGAVEAGQQVRYQGMTRIPAGKKVYSFTVSIAGPHDCYGSWGYVHVDTTRTLLDLTRVRGTQTCI